MCRNHYPTAACVICKTNVMDIRKLILSAALAVAAFPLAAQRVFTLDSCRSMALAGNKQLKALALLIDSRLPPQKLDLDLASFARQCGLPILPVLTKADKCKQRERAARAAEWRDIVGIMPIVTSSEKKLGIPALWDALARAAGATAPAGDAAPAAAGAQGEEA